MVEDALLFEVIVPFSVAVDVETDDAAWAVTVGGVTEREAVMKV